jgi:putative spermidine/putrescine transport system ATP-binding protein
MLLDEPLSMLDARVRSEMRFELRRIVKDLGLTAIHVTHDQEEAMAISDRVFVMRKGGLVEQGKPADLYFRPQKLFTAYFLGESNIVLGRVERSDESETLVRIGHQRLSALGGEFARGSRVAVVIRPELIEIEANGGSGCMKGRVMSSTFEGPFMRHVVRVGEHFFLRVKEPVTTSASRLDKGQVVGLRVRREHARAYNFPAGGLNTEFGP